jgi:hypothetical protein
MFYMKPLATEAYASSFNRVYSIDSGLALGSNYMNMAHVPVFESYHDPVKQVGLYVYRMAKKDDAYSMLALALPKPKIDIRV